MDSLEEMGKKAYQKQMWGMYEDAVSVYTDAIRRFPNDGRLLNNRCMCYLEQKDYKRAMEDAERMILLFSTNKKSYFRKGEVLMNLKNYPQAEESFKEALRLDPKCEDTLKQLLEAQTQELCKKGKYPRKNVQRALRMTNSVEEAERFLKSGQLEALTEEWDEIIYYSDEEANAEAVSDHDLLTDPSNPLGSTTLWIGNVTKEVTEQTLKNLFGKYGRIKSVRLSGQYAFVNFCDSVGPGRAMKNLQGTILGGKNIIIKFPDSASSKKTAKGK